MEKEILSVDTFTISLFEQINNDLIQWNLNAVEGRGMFIKHHRYAHVDIRMYNSEEENHQNYIRWNFPDENIQKGIDYKTGIETSLIFFTKYLSGLRGKQVYLTFEITDASYHPVDTRGSYDYEIATLYAIFSCFNKQFFKFNKQTVMNIKANSIAYIKSLNNDN